jgi:hypothetical protein
MRTWYVPSQRVRPLYASEIEALDVERVDGRDAPDRGLGRRRLALQPLDDPREHASVLAEARQMKLP